MKYDGKVYMVRTALVEDGYVLCSRSFTHSSLRGGKGRMAVWDSADMCDSLTNPIFIPGKDSYATSDAP